MNEIKHKIKITNFHHIQCNKFININKLTVFIGNVGLIDKNIAYLILDFKNLEKILYQNKVEDHNLIDFETFKPFLKHSHSSTRVAFENMFKNKNDIEYIGELYTLKIQDSRITIKRNVDFETYQYEHSKIRRLISSVDILKCCDIVDDLRPQFKYTSLISPNIEKELQPKDQKEVLFKLLSFLKIQTRNEVIFSTHSPYILFNLNFAVVTYHIQEKLKPFESKVSPQEIDKIYNIVPKNSCICPEDIFIYTVNDDGNIELSNKELGLIDAENILESTLNQFTYDLDYLNKTSRDIQINALKKGK